MSVHYAVETLQAGRPLIIDGLLSDPDLRTLVLSVMASWKARAGWHVRMKTSSTMYKLPMPGPCDLTDLKRIQSQASGSLGDEAFTYFYYEISESDSRLIEDKSVQIAKEIIVGKYLTDIVRGMGIRDTKTRFAFTAYDEDCYAGYHNDYDSEAGSDAYKLTVLLYLTPAISNTDGGELVFGKGDSRTVISPTLNRCVIFRPGPESYHMVRPMRSDKTRLAFSGWLF